MPINDNAVLMPGRGNVLVFDPLDFTETDIPTVDQLEAYAADYMKLPPKMRSLGHTSTDDLPAWDGDGGDTEVKGSWERQKLREVAKDVEVNWFAVKALQFDNEIMSLASGGGDASRPEQFWAPTRKKFPELGALIVYIDSVGGVIGELVPRCSVRKDDNIEHATDEFSAIPLRFTQLTPMNNLAEHIWIGRNFGSKVPAAVDPGLVAAPVTAPAKA